MDLLACSCRGDRQALLDQRPADDSWLHTGDNPRNLGHQKILIGVSNQPFVGAVARIPCPNSSSDTSKRFKSGIFPLGREPRKWPVQVLGCRLLFEIEYGNSGSARSPDLFTPQHLGRLDGVEAVEPQAASGTAIYPFGVGVATFVVVEEHD